MKMSMKEHKKRRKEQNANYNKKTQNHREYKQRYYSTARGKSRKYASNAKYKASEKGQKTIKEYGRKYYQRLKSTPEGQKRLKEAKLKNYGLTLKEYNDLFTVQKGLDAITGLPLTNPCVDHNHETKKVRGLLNNSINRAIGYFKDNPQWLRSAADYIEKHSCVS